MKTRHDYYEIIRKYAIEPKFIIPITNIRSLIIKSIVNDIVVGIERRNIILRICMRRRIITEYFLEIVRYIMKS